MSLEKNNVKWLEWKNKIGRIAILTLEKLLELIPERERMIMSGLFDPNFQPVDEEFIKFVESEAQRINECLRKMRSSVSKEPYFSSSEEAFLSAYNFLMNEYKTLNGNDDGIDEHVLKVKAWGETYLEATKLKEAKEIEICKKPITDAELSGEQKCSGIRVFMRRIADELGFRNFEDYLKTIGISSADEFVKFKNAYIANLVSQMVGGFVKTKHNIQEIKCGKKATFVIGLASAGKSTIIEQLKIQDSAFHTDADELKELIANTFGISVNEEGVHQLSSYIRDELVAEARKQGVNIIIEKIGDHKQKIAKAAKDLADDGYEVGLSYVHVNNRKSRMGNVARCAEACIKAQEEIDNGVPVNKIAPPRMVEDINIQKHGLGPLETFLTMFFTKDDENSPFKGPFFACDNEVVYRGSLTAQPIILYGLSSYDAIGCSEIEAKHAEESYRRIKRTLNREISEKMFKGEIILGAKFNVQEEQSKFLSFIRNNSDEEEWKKDLEFVNICMKCENLLADFKAGVQLGPNDLELLKTYVLFFQLVKEGLWEIYNPENATVEIDLRSYLESFYITSGATREAIKALCSSERFNEIMKYWVENMQIQTIKNGNINKNHRTKFEKYVNEKFRDVIPQKTKDL